MAAESMTQQLTQLHTTHGIASGPDRKLPNCSNWSTAHKALASRHHECTYQIETHPSRMSAAIQQTAMLQLLSIEIRQQQAPSPLFPFFGVSD